MILCWLLICLSFVKTFCGVFRLWVLNPWPFVKACLVCFCILFSLLRNIGFEPLIVWALINALTTEIKLLSDCGLRSLFSQLKSTTDATRWSDLEHITVFFHLLIKPTILSVSFIACLTCIGDESSSFIRPKIRPKPAPFCPTRQ